MWETPTIVNPDTTSVLKGATFHNAIVRKVEGDPAGLNRVQIECPEMYHTGKDNWTDWVEMCGMPIGGTHNQGDTGISWPMSPRQPVLLAFLGGDQMQPVAFPAGPFSTDKEGKKALLPRETNEAIKKDKGHLIYQLKTPDGAGLIINTEVGKGVVALMGEGGAGLFISGKSKGIEPTQTEGEETKPRTAHVRKQECVDCRNQKGPGELFVDGTGYVKLLGQNGSGITMIDAKDGSGMIIRTAESLNSENGPSIFMSSLDGGSIILTAGQAQIQIRGKTGDVKFNKNIIEELIKFEVEKAIKELMNKTKEDSRKAFWIPMGTTDT
jgi:hypothetical protein